MIKKADIILFFSLIILSAAIFCSFFIFNQNEGNTLIITVNNEEYARLPLNKNTEIVLDGNTVTIKDGFAFVRDADCPDKVCIHTGKINKIGQTVVCLPNSLILEVE